ncbi:MAG: hypothetical protein Q9180_006307, partial [Flavoplaca navasiana]
QPVRNVTLPQYLYLHARHLASANRSDNNQLPSRGSRLRSLGLRIHRGSRVRRLDKLAKHYCIPGMEYFHPIRYYHFSTVQRHPST